MSLRHPKTSRSSAILSASAQWPRHAAAAQARRAWLDVLMGRPEPEDRVSREAQVADAGDGRVVSASIYDDETAKANRQPRPHDYSAATSANPPTALAATADVDATGGAFWNSILGDDTSHGMQRFGKLVALFILLAGSVFWLLTP
ncbi:hypothetical protein HT585_25795 [Ensifer sp. HO-A22]|uniref:Uncharacterized protein n=1 Tax=Ensifer oleiphilus TaxID=2742698 RepID=A0A7Y6QAW6_9HYPH|nr:hypothetical protein [Ensifer oleiphilus]NVD42290.1 hypothetical protein [Ensifer oleiphilus]